MAGIHSLENLASNGFICTRIRSYAKDSHVTTLSYQPHTGSPLSNTASSSSAPISKENISTRASRQAL